MRDRYCPATFMSVRMTVPASVSLIIYRHALIEEESKTWIFPRSDMSRGE